MESLGPTWAGAFTLATNRKLAFACLREELGPVCLDVGSWHSIWHGRRAGTVITRFRKRS